jgi:RNA polymerase sigma-70 factor, ECF subfamily
MKALDFQTLFTLELAYVMRTLRRLGVYEADLEDVTHEVFIAVHRSLAEYDTSRPVKPWLFGFAFRFASNYRRKLRPADELAPDDHLSDSQPLADEALSRADDRRLVLAALERIPLARRAIFVMHELDGLAIVDIARVLTIRLGKARAEFSEAIAKLARKESHGRTTRTAS